VFSLSGGKILLVIVIALLLFGPDKIPQMARMVGRFMREFNKYKDLMDSTVRAEIYKADWKAKAEEDAKARGQEIYGPDLKPAKVSDEEAQADEAEGEGAEGEGAEAAPAGSEAAAAPAGSEAAAAPVKSTAAKAAPAKKRIAPLAEVIATDEDEEDGV
jgi:TatA/E family protein of Tat protein translocase